MERKGRAVLQARRGVLGSVVVVAVLVALIGAAPPAGGMTAQDDAGRSVPTPTPIFVIPDESAAVAGAQQPCNGGTLTGGYMADAGAEGAAFLSLVQSGTAVSGFWVTVGPDDETGTASNTVPVHGTVSGDALTLMLSGLFGGQVTLTGRRDGCGFVLP